MRTFSLFIFLLFHLGTIEAQIYLPHSYSQDSLRSVLEQNLHDTTRINVLLQLSGSYFFKQPDSSLLYANQALEISYRSNSTKAILFGGIRAAEAMRQSGMFADAMKKNMEVLELSQKVGDRSVELNSYGFIGMTYVDLQSYDNAFSNLKKALASRGKLGRERTEFLFMIYIARAFNETNKPDSAFYFLKEAKKTLQHVHLEMNAPQLPVLLANTLGETYLTKNNLDSANFYYRQAFKLALKHSKAIPNHFSMSSHNLATVFIKKSQFDSGLYFARIAYVAIAKTKHDPRILDASALLAQLHRKAGRLDSALYYYDIATAMNDNLYGKDKSNKLQLVQLEQQKRTQEIQQTSERFRSNILIVGLVSVVAIILIASLSLFRSNRIKQRTNLVLQQTLDELKATQSQLIQSEKMASLGELTAGIAHEIQNPLNFVNNFSELNKELIDELNLNVKEGKIHAVQKLAADIKENEEKIEHHGKRADAIVKSMLQHSRTSSGKKEPTDINSLCDEYSRLAYHGYRAKDKSFYAKLEIDFDQSLPTIHAIPQDIGRVILNLINNAFYAVNERRRRTERSMTGWWLSQQKNQMIKLRSA
jgi:signal transduction histidine kinase